MKHHSGAVEMKNTKVEQVTTGEPAEQETTVEPEEQETTKVKQRNTTEEMETMARPAEWRVRVKLETTGDLEAMTVAETGSTGDIEFRACIHGCNREFSEFRNSLVYYYQARKNRVHQIWDH